MDLAAPFVLGRLALVDGAGTLQSLADSDDPLRQRSALLGALTLVRRQGPADALRLTLGMLGATAEQLQRTVGALLREIGKRDPALLAATLEQHAPRMTAVSLRIATEKLAPAQRERLRALRSA